MLRLRPLFVAASLCSIAAPARAACVGARAAPGVGAQPPAWRDAVDALIRSTVEPAHPWSCVGGVVDLVVRSNGATLLVHREGDEPAARELASPDELVPLGQALLSLAPVPAPPPASPVVAATAAPEPASAPAPPPPAPVAPRVVLGAGVDARHAGRSRVDWLGASLSAAIPIERWRPGVFVRYDGLTLGKSRGPAIDEVVFGAFAWRLSATERWRAGLSLSAAIVRRDLPRPAGGDTHLGPRVGALVGRSFELGHRLRGVVTVDAEAGPSGDDGGNDQLRPLPSYTIGLGWRVEWSP